MADISDVQTALVGLITSTLYPNGTAQPSLTGKNYRIYPGWVDASTLDADLAALNADDKNATNNGRIHISVFPRPEERRTTRFLDNWNVLTAPAPTLTVTQMGQVVTLGGTVSTPQNVAIVTKAQAYLYAVQAADTLTSIAAAVAALIPGATSTGPAITVPNGVVITAARVGASGTFYRERKRQKRSLQICIWANSDANRSLTASPLDVALASTEFLTLPDGTAGWLLYESSPIIDANEKVQLYRRDLFYTVDYATIQTTQAFQVITLEQITQVTNPDGSVTITNTLYN